ncbi:MAG: hypothetical protein OHK0037_23090 [Elainellaceae cyanobacterium]
MGFFLAWKGKKLGVIRSGLQIGLHTALNSVSTQRFNGLAVELWRNSQAQGKSKLFASSADISRLPGQAIRRIAKPDLRSALC